MSFTPLNQLPPRRFMRCSVIALQIASGILIGIVAGQASPLWIIPLTIFISYLSFLAGSMQADVDRIDAAKRGEEYDFTREGR